MPRWSQHSARWCAALFGWILILAVPALPARGDDVFLRDFLSLGDRVVFKAVDAQGDAEPWVSDGTAAGTRQLVDVCPGPCGTGLEFVRDGAEDFFLLPFDPAQPFQLSQLWHSDGTPAGTVPLLPAGEAPSSGSLTLAHGLFYFSSCPDSVCRLWRTDGTPSGTEVVPGFPAAPLPFAVAVQGDAVYVTARNDSGGGTLWKTDGPHGAAVRLRDFSRPPIQPTAFGGQIYFLVQREHSLRDELWASDGSPAGTRMVRLLPGAVLWLLAVDSSLYLYVETPSLAAIWQSDGTSDGTHRLSARVHSLVYFFLPELELVEGRLFFGVEARFGTLELWSVDGTPGSTRAWGPTVPFRAPWVRLGDQILWSHHTDGLGAELWQSDAQGSRPLFDLCPGPCSGFLAGPTSADGRVYFAAATPRFGPQLWSTDGTVAGTRRHTRFTAGVPGGEVGIAGAATFFALYGTGSPETAELWITFGSRASSRKVAEIGLNPAPSQ